MPCFGLHDRRINNGLLHKGCLGGERADNTHTYHLQETYVDQEKEIEESDQSVDIRHN